MAQAVGRLLVIAKARVRSQVSPFEICGEQSGTGTAGCTSASVFPTSLSYRQCSILICIVNVTLSEGRAGEAWEPSNKAINRALGRKMLARWRLLVFRLVCPRR